MESKPLKTFIIYSSKDRILREELEVNALRTDRISALAKREEAKTKTGHEYSGTRQRFKEATEQHKTKKDNSRLPTSKKSTGSIPLDINVSRSRRISTFIIPKFKNGQIIQDLPNTPEMVFVEGGTFLIDCSPKRNGSLRRVAAPYPRGLYLQAAMSWTKWAGIRITPEVQPNPLVQRSPTNLDYMI